MAVLRNCLWACLLLFNSGCNPLGTVSTVDTDFGSRTPESQTYTWNITSDSNYSVSDTSRIVISADGAALQSVDQTHNSSSDFSGTKIGTYYNGSRFTLQESSYAELSSDWTPEYSSLVAYFKFNGSWNNEIGTGNLTPAGNSTFTYGKIGSKAATFDGVGDTASATLTGSAIFDFSDDITISFWMAPDIAFDNPTDNHFVPIGLNCSPGYMLSLWLMDSAYSSPGDLRFYIYDGTSSIPNGNAADLTTNQYHHFVYIRRANKLEVYVDGVATTPATANMNATGAVCKSLAIGYANYKGLIDDLAIWKKAISASDVSTVYARQSASYANDTSLSSAWTPQYSSLVGYWKMDGNWKDSIGTNHGTAYDNATYDTSAKIGSHAGTFDGTNDKVSVNYSATLNPATFTYMIWAKVMGGAGTFRSPATSRTGIIQGFAFYANSSNRWSVYLGSTNPSWIDVGNTQSVVIGEWTHLAVTYSGAVALFYLNGNLYASHTMSDYVANPSAPLYIGAGHTESAGDYWFNGTVDDFAVWNTPLTAAEISLIYNRQKQKYSGMYSSSVIDSQDTSASWQSLAWTTDLPFLKELPGAAGSELTSNYPSLDATSSLDTNLKGLWHFDESSWSDVADEVVDSSGHGNHGRAKNGPTITKNGVLHNAGVFDGTNDRILLNSPDSIGTTSTYSIGAWVKLSATPSANAAIYIECESVNSHTRNYLYVTTANKVSLDQWTPGGGASTSTGTLTVGKWAHVVVVRDGATRYFYIDGQASGTGTGETYTGNTPNIGMIGARCTGASIQEPFPGSIDEVAVWDRALSSTEVAQLYRRGANRIKFQMRSCDDSACSGESWLGPDNTNSHFFFSELNNCVDRYTTKGFCDYWNGGNTKTSSPTLLATDFNGLNLNTNRYFQYRLLMESDDESTSPTFPTLTSLAISPPHYYPDQPTITSTTGPAFSTWSGLSATVTGDCSIKFQVSNNLSSWYYFNGNVWAPASDSTQSSSATVLNTSASTFVTQVGKGTLYFKAVLVSNGTQSCTLKNVTATYTQ